MNIEMTDPKGIVLKTRNKFCEEDITVSPKLQDTIDIAENGEYTVDDGHVGIKKVKVNVEPKLHMKIVDVTGNGEITVKPDDGYEGMSEVLLLIDVLSSGDPNLEDYDGSYTMT